MDNAEHSFELLSAGDDGGLRGFLDEHPSAADACDSTGISLLMHSLYRGRRDLAEVVAAKKSALDIFEASSLGRLDQLVVCLRDPSALNSRSKDGFTALHFACYFGQAETVRVLLEKGAAPDAVASNPMQVMPLHSAASARNAAAARLLLEHGAPVNARQQSGYAPLHAAAQNGDLAMVELLLQYGGDAKAANDDGKTPAMIAREKGHEAIALRMERAA